MNMQLIESADGLVIVYETWFRFLALAFGSFFAVAALFVRQHRTRVVVIGVIGAVMGIYPLTFEGQLSPEGGSAYALLRYDNSVYWSDVSSVDMERRHGRRAVTAFIVAQTEDEPFELDVTGLSERQRERVLEYVEAQVAAASK